MSEPSAPSSTSTAKPAAEGDWTDQVTELIVDGVDKVRARTTGPILEISKGMVFAVVAIVIALPVLVLALLGVTRLLTYFMPVWAAYLLIGSIFVLVGVVLWSKRGRVPT